MYKNRVLTKKFEVVNRWLKVPHNVAKIKETYNLIKG